MVKKEKTKLKQSMGGKGKVSSKDDIDDDSLE
jgi:hypothetical protein